MTVLGYGLIGNARPREAIAPLIKLGQERPEYKQAIVSITAPLLQRAYATQPAAVAEEFHALTHLDVPAWMTEQAASQR